MNLLYVNCIKQSLTKLRTIFSLKMLFRDIHVCFLLFSFLKNVLILLDDDKLLPVNFLRACHSSAFWKTCWQIFT